jgi:hypothetical protein
VTLPIADYCREIESYLCRKNDGHLVRVVGPSFELVSGWAERGVPLKVAFSGIDRYFERYYRERPRRRPVRIDFCEPDVLDVFDDWKRAVGVGAPSSRADGPATGDGDDAPRDGGAPSVSLPEHLRRVTTKLTSARALHPVGAACDGVLDRLAAELDAARQGGRGLRGAARDRLVDRLAVLDTELVAAARSALDPESSTAFAREADDELATFRSSLSPDAFARARQAIVDRLVREHFGLPTIAYW